eukprot:6210327-Pleurochrysis_carterae.AAC.3
MDSVLHVDSNLVLPTELRELILSKWPSADVDILVIAAKCASLCIDLKTFVKSFVLFFYRRAALVHLLASALCDALVCTINTRIQTLHAICVCQLVHARPAPRECTHM